MTEIIDEFTKCIWNPEKECPLLRKLVQMLELLAFTEKVEEKPHDQMMMVLRGVSASIVATVQPVTLVSFLQSVVNFCRICPHFPAKYAKQVVTP